MAARAGGRAPARGIRGARSEPMLASAEMRVAYPTPEWEPVLHGSLAGRALEAAVDIGEALRAVPVTDASLARGAAGRALLAAYLSRVVPGAGFERDAR